MNELNQYREIIFASIDYILERKTFRIKFDGYDPDVIRFEKIKSKADQLFKKGELEQLKKLFIKITKEPGNIVDSSFDTYINQKTGYKTDVLAKLEERVEIICQTKKIRNESEYDDMIAMMTLLAKSKKSFEKINSLKALVEDYNNKKSISDLPFYHKELSKIFSPNGKYFLSVYEGSVEGDIITTYISLNVPSIGGAGIYSVVGSNLEIIPFWENDDTIVIKSKREYEVVSLKIQQIQIGQEIFNIELMLD